MIIHGSYLWWWFRRVLGELAWQTPPLPYPSLSHPPALFPILGLQALPHGTWGGLQISLVLEGNPILVVQRRLVVNIWKPWRVYVISISIPNKTLGYNVNWIIQFHNSPCTAGSTAAKATAIMSALTLPLWTINVCPRHTSIALNEFLQSYMLGETNDNEVISNIWTILFYVDATIGTKWFVAVFHGTEGYLIILDKSVADFLLRWYLEETIVCEYVPCTWGQVMDVPIVLTY